jgi:hypothetical protein
MAPAQTLIWRFFFKRNSFDASIKILNLLSKVQFDGEEVTFAPKHVLQFIQNCISYNIFNQDVMCKLFTSTIEGRVRRWCETLPIASIHTFKQFIDEFLSVFAKYDFDRLCDEFNHLRKEKVEPLEDFSIRFMHLYCQFPLNDIPPIDEWFLYYFLNEHGKLNIN